MEATIYFYTYFLNVHDGYHEERSIRRCQVLNFIQEYAYCNKNKAVTNSKNNKHKLHK